MLAAVESGEMQIADCRMDSTWYAAGAHIPGAMRLPAPSLVRPEDGTLRDAAGVRRLLAEAGIDASRPIALYCGGGVSAAQAFMACAPLAFSQHASTTAHGANGEPIRPPPRCLTATADWAAAVHTGRSVSRARSPHRGGLMSACVGSPFGPPESAPGDGRRVAVDRGRAGDRYRAGSYSPDPPLGRWSLRQLPWFNRVSRSAYEPIRKETAMSTFGLVHGHWHGAWCWDRLIPELESRGHRAVAMDLPCETRDAGGACNAQVVKGAIADCGEDIVLVGHSAGGLTIPLVAQDQTGTAADLHRRFAAAAWPQPRRAVRGRARDYPSRIQLHR